MENPFTLKVGQVSPFTLKVGQVFTGFGIGCGVGIGVGRPLYLGAIPALQQVMSATRGATDVFSGVGRHVNNSLRRLGVKSIEAGVGCGVGFGYGFGVGLAIKPGVLRRLQSDLGEAVAMIMTKLGVSPVSVNQSIVPGSLQSSMHMISGVSHGNASQLASKTTEIVSHDVRKDGIVHEEFKNESLASNGVPSETSPGSRTEKVINNFLQNPMFKNEAELEINELGGQLRSENNVLLVLLKHQQVIEELLEENEKLRQILVEDLKVSPSKLQPSNRSLAKSTNPCADCFECRRRRRK